MTVALRRLWLPFNNFGKSFKRLQADQPNLAYLENRLHANTTLSLLGVEIFCQLLGSSPFQTRGKRRDSKA